MKYRNFRDPLGLIRRMLASGEEAARFTLFREALSMGMTPVDFLLAMAEGRRISRLGNKPGYPLILILGGSRSGTTLLYQVLAHTLPVSYFTNWSAVFSKASITGSLLAHPWLNRRKPNFKNYFGNVAGLAGPNDGFFVWNRWLGNDRNAIRPGISQEEIEEIGSFVNTWTQSFGKPLLNKNNRNTFAVDIFEQALPGQVFYPIIRRDPRFVAQSLIRSREEIQGSKALGWGLGSTNSDLAKDPLAYVDDVCDQVWLVERSLQKAEKLVGPDRIIQVTYSELCADPVGVANRVSTKIFGHPVAPEQLNALSAFEHTNRIEVSPEEWDRLNKRLEKCFGRREMT